MQSDVENNSVSTDSESEDEEYESNKDDNYETQDTVSRMLNCASSTLREDLTRLIIECSIPHTTANKLLTIMRKYGHVDLAKDVRLLLSTPRNASLNIVPLGDGYYKHFGLSSGLKRSIQTYYKFIKGNLVQLNINVDGLPISKSSGSQFWPILAAIEEIDIYTSPFIIGIYHGMLKPKNANEFLTEFVNEYIQLLETGITVCDKKFQVILNAILCDTPAKSFITYTKGHAGYFSCSKCIQEGDFICKRMTYPETNNILRTNDTFRNRTQIEHHTGDSILEELNIGMVSQIPIDYMCT